MPIHNIAIDRQIGDITLLSGTSYSAVVSSKIYRKVSIRSIEIIDDNEWTGDGRFRLDVFVDRQFVGSSNVFIQSEGELRNFRYEFVFGISEVNQFGRENVIIIEVILVELNRIFSNTVLLKGCVELKSSNNFGLHLATPGSNVSLGSASAKLEVGIDSLNEGSYYDLLDADGIVYGLSGSVAGNARIKIRDYGSKKVLRDTSTNRDGLFRIDPLPLPPGLLQIEILAEGLKRSIYRQNSSSIGNSVFTMLAPLLIRGNVTDMQRRPISEAGVDVYGLKVYISKDTRNKLPDSSLDEKGRRLKDKKGLKCFREPSTDTTHLVDVIEKGEYDVLEVREKYPTDESDFIKIRCEFLDAKETWVCARWNKSYYALIFYKKCIHNAATTINGKFTINLDRCYPDQMLRIKSVKKDYFDTTSDAFCGMDYENEGTQISIRMEKCRNSIPEKALTDLLSSWADYQYSYPLRFPYELSNYTGSTFWRTGNPKNIVCTSFVQGLLAKAWDDQHGVNWGDTKYRIADIICADGTDFSAGALERPFSNIELYEMESMASALDANEMPPPWTVVQHWNVDTTRKVGNPPVPAYEYTDEGLKRSAAGINAGVDKPYGHAYIIVDVHQQTGRLLRLESTSYSAHNGPCYRGLADIDEFEKSDYLPGEKWWKNESLQTWEQLRTSAARPFRRMARLRIYDVSFAGQAECRIQRNQCSAIPRYSLATDWV